MSIFIKGMEMPQAGDVVVCGQIDGKLQATIVTRGKQTKWCEISKVPTPHGRLIDADKLMIAVLKAMNSEKDDSVIGLIEKLPTIIEAED